MEYRFYYWRDPAGENSQAVEVLSHVEDVVTVRSLRADWPEVSWEVPESELRQHSSAGNGLQF